MNKENPNNRPTRVIIHNNHLDIDCPFFIPTEKCIGLAIDKKKEDLSNIADAICNSGKEFGFIITMMKIKEEIDSIEIGIGTPYATTYFSIVHSVVEALEKYGIPTDISKRIINPLEDLILPTELMSKYSKKFI